jgi:hypothetical protein
LVICTRVPECKNLGWPTSPGSPPSRRSDTSGVTIGEVGETAQRVPYHRLTPFGSDCARTIVLLLQDNLNTHSKASLYEAFPAAEARRLVERFEWHYTPKHGSWLDLAESELGVLSSQCLDRRIPDKQTLIDEIAAWEHDRNANHTKANWQFTTPNARIKLKHLYPSI